jgi:hypothetical protein
MLQQYFSPSEQFWLDWISDCPNQVLELCEKALGEDHKYLKVSIRYNEALIEANGDLQKIVENIEFWTLKYRCPEVH